MPCSVTEELPIKVETWKLVQVCLVDAEGRNIRKWVHSNGAEWSISGKQVCHSVTLLLVQGMQLRQLSVYATSGEKRVIRRDEQVLDHVMWPRHGMTASLSTLPCWTVQVHSQCWVDVGVLQRVWTFLFQQFVARLVTRMPLRWFPLSRDHQRLRLQWACERRHWRSEWRNVVFSDEFRFNMSYNDGRILVRRYAGERNLRACILQRHRGPTPTVMVWSAVGYNMRSRLLRIEGNLNSNRHSREALQPEVLPLLQATPHATFQQDNARPHMASIVKVFFHRERVSLFPWPARLPDMSPIELVWDIVGRRLIHQAPPAPTLDSVWTRIQTAWRDIPQEDIQGLFDSMPRRIETLIAAHGGFTPYWNHMLTDHIQFCNSNRLSIVMYLICGIHFISVTYLLGVAIFTNSSVFWKLIGFLELLECSAILQFNINIHKELAQHFKVYFQGDFFLLRP